MADAPKLLGAPYRPPSVRKGPRGAMMYDILRGDMHAVGTSDAPIPWPVAPTRPGSPPTPIVDAELVRAIRTESRQAVAYWWGVSLTMAWRWRRALRVERFNAGTMARWSELSRGKLTDEARLKALERYRAGLARRRATTRG